MTGSRSAIGAGVSPEELVLRKAMKGLLDACDALERAAGWAGGSRGRALRRVDLRDEVALRDAWAVADTAAFAKRTSTSPATSSVAPLVAGVDALVAACSAFTDSFAEDGNAVYFSPEALAVWTGARLVAWKVLQRTSATPTGAPAPASGSRELLRDELAELLSICEAFEQRFSRAPLPEAGSTGAHVDEEAWDRFDLDLFDARERAEELGGETFVGDDRFVHEALHDLLDASDLFWASLDERGGHVVIPADAHRAWCQERAEARSILVMVGPATKERAAGGRGALSPTGTGRPPDPEPGRVSESLGEVAHVAAPSTPGASAGAHRARAASPANELLARTQAALEAKESAPVPDIGPLPDWNRLRDFASERAAKGLAPLSVAEAEAELAARERSMLGALAALPRPTESAPVAARAAKVRKPGERHRLDSQVLNKIFPLFEAVLQRDHPALYAEAVRAGHGLLGTLVTHAEVRVEGLTFLDAHDDMEQRRASLPPVRLQTGDFVFIRGRIFRVGQVYAQRREVVTERLDEEGGVVSSCPCSADYPDGRALEPLVSAREVAIEARSTGRDGYSLALSTLQDVPGAWLDRWPDFPPGMKDGRSRARFVSLLHLRHLVAVGLASEDD